MDHILFVLGLFLLSAHWKPCWFRSPSFTVAHTVTLALSIYGIASVLVQIVEPLIALSIVYVGFENMMTKELKRWRPILVFVFGLLHGLGFAGVLGEIGIPDAFFLESLIAFNLGVELGQLAVIGIAYLMVGLFFSKSSWVPENGGYSGVTHDFPDWRMVVYEGCCLTDWSIKSRVLEIYFFTTIFLLILVCFAPSSIYAKCTQESRESASKPGSIRKSSNPVWRPLKRIMFSRSNLRKNRDSDPGG